jgi:hypothetical protein
MTEEKFFKGVHDSLSNYAPEVPASVYTGMRRKMWLNGFLSMKWNQLNVWYVLLGASMLSAVLFMNTNESVIAKKVDQASPIMEQVKATVSNTAVQAASVVDHSSTVSTSSIKSCSTALSCTSKQEATAAKASVTEKPTEVMVPNATEPALAEAVSQEEISVEEELGTQPEIKKAVEKKKKGRKMFMDIIVDETTKK